MIAKTAQELPNLPFALSIGVFDGVHLGHQKLLQELRKTGAPTLVLTFSNHPAEILRPHAVPRAIASLEVRLQLLSQFVDHILLLPFTPALANTPFDQLLDQIPLSHLFIGQGDAFGKGRMGDETNLRAYCATRKIQLHVVEKSPCSSSLIRKLIELGDLDGAAKLLGHESYVKAHQ